MNTQSLSFSFLKFSPFSIIPFSYTLWKDGVFMKLANRFKDKQQNDTGNEENLTVVQQQEAFSLASQLQRYFVLRSNQSTTLTWRQWFTLTSGLKYALEELHDNVGHQIGYLIGNLPTPRYGNDHDALMDGVGHLMVNFPIGEDSKQEVSNSHLERILRDFMFALRREVYNYDSYQIKRIKNSLRDLQMIMLTGGNN